MARFFPPESEVERAGAVHVLTSSEADCMQMTGTLVWDEARQGLVLAPGKEWSDYVTDMRVIEPPEQDLHYEDYDDWGDPEPFEDHIEVERDFCDGFDDDPPVKSPVVHSDPISPNTALSDALLAAMLKGAS